MDEPMYQPPDALEAPRFTGPRTYARLPHVRTLEGVDCAVFGLPWDGGTSYRPGARFGPQAIRAASSLLRPYNSSQRVRVFGRISAIDLGDAATVPGYIEDTLHGIAEFVRPIADAGVIPLAMGGDHSVTLGELRALAAVHGPLGLVQFDAHADLWDQYNGRSYSHGTFVKRAIEERLLDPARVVQVGLRGSLYDEQDFSLPLAHGVEAITCTELSELSVTAFAERVSARLGNQPTFVTFDVDFLDPAYCPGTGTPEVGGPTSNQALELVRSLRGLSFVGFDVVEVAPQYDGPGEVTALLAAHVLYEMLSLVALQHGAGTLAARGSDAAP